MAVLDFYYCCCHKCSRRFDLHFDYYLDMTRYSHWIHWALLTNSKTSDTVIGEHIYKRRRNCSQLCASKNTPFLLNRELKTVSKSNQCAIDLHTCVGNHHFSLCIFVLIKSILCKLKKKKLYYFILRTIKPLNKRNKWKEMTLRVRNDLHDHHLQTHMQEGEIIGNVLFFSIFSGKSWRRAGVNQMKSFEDREERA